MNELDWWIASQWEEMPTKTKFKTRSNAQGTEIKSHAYRALRRSRLKEMHAVRYADDFKIDVYKRQVENGLFHAQMCTVMLLK